MPSSNSTSKFKHMIFLKGLSSISEVNSQYPVLIENHFWDSCFFILFMYAMMPFDTGTWNLDRSKNTFLYSISHRRRQFDPFLSSVFLAVFHLVSYLRPMKCTLKRKFITKRCDIVTFCTMDNFRVYLYE